MSIRKKTIRRGKRFKWVCKLLRFHWDDRIYGDLCNHTVSCRICQRMLHRWIEWPPPPRPSRQVFEASHFLTPDEVQRLKEAWNEMYNGA